MNEVFENTVIAVLSGSGNRMVDNHLFTTWMEQRMPLISIKLPEKFRQKYPMQDLNMGVNVN
ncbi:hypothetical protein DICVIV_14017, partial [Dictyocaulus viviparus]